MATTGPTPLFTPFTMEINAEGSGSANLGSPPLGFNWQGMVTLATQIAGQQVSVKVGPSVTAYGGQQSGSFSAGSGQQITVTVTGGTPSTQLNGLLQGTIYPGNQAQPPQLQPLGDLIQISAGVVYIEPGSNPIDVTGSVTITGGTITVEPGASPIDISGTVDIASGQTVIVEPGSDPLVTSGTVEISSGSVTIVEGQGGQTPVQTSQPPVEEGTVTATTSGVTTAIALPNGTHSVGLLVEGPLANLALVGATSGVYYLGSTTLTPFPTGSYMIPVNSGVDTTVNVVASSRSGSVTIAVAAILDTEAVVVQNALATPLFTKPSAGYFGPIAQSTNVLNSPPQFSALISVNLTVGATTTIVPAIANTSVRMRSAHMSTSGTTEWGFQTTPYTAPAVTLVGTAAASNPGAQVNTITMPSAAKVGDIALVYANNGGTGNTTGCLGWTLIAVDGYTQTLLARTVQAGDAGSVFSFSNAADGCTAIMAVYRNVIGIGPSGYSTTNLVAPSVTARESGDWLACFWSAYYGGSVGTFSVTPPAAMTSDITESGADTGGAGSYGAVAGAHLNLTVSGGTATQTATSTGTGTDNVPGALSVILYNYITADFDAVQQAANSFTGEMDWQGYALPVGLGLVLTNIAGATSNFFGRVLYDQY